MKALVLSLGLLMLLTSGNIPKNQKSEVTEIIYGEVQVPCLTERLVGEYELHYTFWENKWKLKIEATMFGAVSGIEYRFTTLTNVQGHRSTNPSLREHNTATYTLLLWQGNELIGKINGVIHNSFLDNRIISEIENMHTQCK